MGGLRRRLRAGGAVAASCLAAALLLPAQGQAMELGVSDFGTYANSHQGDDNVIPRAFMAAGYVGARWSREIVERGPFYDGSGNATSFGFSRLDRWVNDVTAHEMRPFLTLTNARQLKGGVDQITERERTADAATYAAWCGQVADRYDGSDPAHPLVNDFSVWNEPNLSRVGNLAPTRYFNYYVACRFAIKQRNRERTSTSASCRARVRRETRTPASGWRTRRAG